MRIVRCISMVCILILIIPAQRGLYAQEESTIEVIPDESEKKSAALEKRVKELEEKLAALEEKKEEDELAKLREEAEKEADEDEADEDEDVKVFSSGARALQALNPEISITGDFLGRVFINDEVKKPYRGGGHDEEGHSHSSSASDLSGFEIRTIGLSLQTNLDPYAFTKVIIGIHGGEFHLGEAYMTWTGIAPRLNLTVGKFRQLFGVINRWHLHALDQVDFPRPITEFFGGGGLNQVGLSLRVLLPRLWAHANELTIQVTNAQNSALFAGDFWSIPSVLGHLKSYYDLNQTTYLEFGLSGIWGFNNKRSYPEEDEETEEVQIKDDPWRNTLVAGADLTIAWEPLDMGKYRWVVWRTEAMYYYKQTEEGTIHALGGFTYLDIRINRIMLMGFRIDAGQQPVHSGPNVYVQAAPYLTFWQSPWVKVRCQYNYLWLSGGREPEHVVHLQVGWSAGPHKHEKY